MHQHGNGHYTQNIKTPEKPVFFCYTRVTTQREVQVSASYQSWAQETKRSRERLRRGCAISGSTSSSQVFQASVRVTAFIENGGICDSKSGNM